MGPLTIVELQVAIEVVLKLGNTFNGSQFIANDFKKFIRVSGMTHVRTSPYYPQSNGKSETLAQIAQRGMHPAGNAAVAR